MGVKVMPMTDEINQIPFTEGADPAAAFDPMIEQQPLIRKPIFDFSKLKAETGQGDLAEYKDHPLNWNRSKGVARMIRGCTGLFGQLNMAVIDILIGWFEYNNENKHKKVAESHDNVRSDGILP